MVADDRHIGPVLYRESEGKNGKAAAAGNG